jgi:AbrB family looped-hinge helix DNA binding protein
MRESAMPLVRVKEKFQVTLPASVREKAGVAVGDVLEAVAESNKITLRPKSVIDRDLARALEDVKKGRVVGPFNSASELLAHLHKRVAAKTKRGKRAKTT